MNIFKYKQKRNRKLYTYSYFGSPIQSLPVRFGLGGLPRPVHIPKYTNHVERYKDYKLEFIVISLVRLQVTNHHSGLILFRCLTSNLSGIFLPSSKECDEVLIGVLFS